MAKAGAPSGGTNLVVYKARGGEEVSLSMETVKNFLVTGNKDLVTVQELVYFIGICKARGLNPFAKDCYLVKYSANEPAAIITAIDFYRSRAKAQPDCVGWEKGVIVKEKETGNIRYSRGLVLDTEDVIGGWFRAKPKGWDMPWELEVNLDEYVKTTRDGAVTAFWKKPAMMIAKVAESQGLRTLWPDEFRGTLAAEEVGFPSEGFEAVKELPLAQEELPPPVNLSEYDKLLGQKNLPKDRAKHVDAFFKAIANKTKATIPSLKEKAASDFANFWEKFEKWEKITYPEVEEMPQESEPQGEGGPAEKAEEEAGPGSLEEKEPPATEPAVVLFADRVTKIWHQIIDKGMPLTTLNSEEMSIRQMNDITPENIDAVQSLVEDYKPKKRR